MRCSFPARLGRATGGCRPARPVADAVPGRRFRGRRNRHGRCSCTSVCSPRRTRIPSDHVRRIGSRRGCPTARTGSSCASRRPRSPRHRGVVRCSIRFRSVAGQSNPTGALHVSTLELSTRPARAFRVPFIAVGDRSRDCRCFWRWCVVASSWAMEYSIIVDTLSRSSTRPTVRRRRRLRRIWHSRLLCSAGPYRVPTPRGARCWTWVTSGSSLSCVAAWTPARSSSYARPTQGGRLAGDGARPVVATTEQSGQYPYPDEGSR